MKTLFILLAAFLNAFYVCGQTSQVESEIRRLEETEHKAMLNRDVAKLQKLWAPDFIVNTPANRITLSSKELFDLLKLGVFNYSSFTRDIEQIFIKDNMAITMGSEAVVPVGKNEKSGQTVKRRYTNIWMKKNGEWRLTARHANEIEATANPK